jgi:hypothetical protein
VVVGIAVASISGSRVFYRWTAVGGIQWLGFLPGYPANNPTASVLSVSPDGSTFAGRFSPTASGTPTDIWKWTQSGGFQVQILPRLALDAEVEFPYAISEDGSVVYGNAVFNVQTPHGNVYTWRAWRWTISEGKHWVSDDFAPAANTWTLGGFGQGGEHGVGGVSADGSVVAGTATSMQGWLGAYRPVIEHMNQGNADPVTGDVTIGIYGVGLEPGATAFLGVNSLVTTFVGPTRLDAVIPGALLAGVTEFATFQITVVGPGGQTSKSVAFPFVNPVLHQIVDTVETEIAPVGEAVSVEVLPASPNSVGLSATFDNVVGTQPASVTVATYTQNPTPTEAFDSGGGYIDLQVSGADPSDQLTAAFYYPSGLDAAAKAALVLMYFDGTNWITVQSSGPSTPTNDFGNNRFVVVFDSTSVPMITDLTGTVFGLADGAPAIINSGAPAGPMPVGTTVSLMIAYSASSTATITVDWGDGTTSAASASGAGAASAMHNYTSAGVYTMVLRITDQEQRRAEYAHRYIVIYDPNGGFVTGGGWITSPVGAYVENPALTGKATFGFVSKYQKGAKVPTGETEFQLHFATFNFKSTSYQWLVVAGAKAQYKGSGSINGSGDYGFLLTATDGQINGGGGVDKFRIKIWNKSTGATVYDNVPSATDDLHTVSPQAISGGSIVVKK